MRRITILVTALVVTVGAGVAYGATRPYTSSLTFHARHSGTATRPAPLAYSLDVKSTATGSVRPPVQLDIKLRIYGMKLDGKDFPTCSLKTIATAGNDTVCPKAAKFASGAITSTLGSASDFSAPGAACDPLLDVWNSGQGKLTFFFVVTPAHQCVGGLRTGSVAPYPGTYKNVGKYFVSDVKVPRYIDYPLSGLVGSLQTEHLDFSTQTKTVHGKTVISQSSTGCLKGKRPYSITTTSTGGATGPRHVIATTAKQGAC